MGVGGRLVETGGNLAKEAIYLLYGTVPLETILHMRVLKLLQKVATNQASAIQGGS